MTTCHIRPFRRGEAPPAGIPPVVTIEITGTYEQGQTLADVTTVVTGENSGEPPLDNGTIGFEVDGTPQPLSYEFVGFEEVVATFSYTHPTGNNTVFSDPVQVLLKADLPYTGILTVDKSATSETYGWNGSSYGGIDPFMTVDNGQENSAGWVYSLDTPRFEVTPRTPTEPFKTSDGTPVDQIFVTIGGETVGPINWVSDRYRASNDAFRNLLIANVGQDLPITIKEPPVPDLPYTGNMVAIAEEAGVRVGVGAILFPGIEAGSLDPLLTSQEAEQAEYALIVDIAAKSLRLHIGSVSSGFGLAFYDGNGVLITTLEMTIEGAANNPYILNWNTTPTLYRTSTSASVADLVAILGDHLLANVGQTLAVTISFPGAVQLPFFERTDRDA